MVFLNIPTIQSVNKFIQNCSILLKENGLFIYYDFNPNIIYDNKIGNIEVLVPTSKLKKYNGMNFIVKHQEKKLYFKNVF